MSKAQVERILGPPATVETKDMMIFKKTTYRYEDGKKFAVVKDGVSLQQLVDGLNGLGIGPRDLIGILQAIKAAGAIQADIEVM